MIKFSTLRQDILSGTVVFLVALPLSLGISVATGMPPDAGLVSAIIGGLIVGALSGCPLQVSGPAAGLITIVAEIMREHSFEKLGLIVFTAGIMQLIFGVLKLGPVFRGVAPAVIQGMLSAIGITILTSQFHTMVGDSPNHDPITNLMLIPSSLVNGLFPLDYSTYHMSALIGVVTITIIMLWNFAPKKLKFFPPALIGVIVCAFISDIYNLPIKHLILPNSITENINLVNPTHLLGNINESFLITAFTLAFVASAETLLTATAIDQMHHGVRTNYNKEIIAQGVGNLIAGSLGVLPLSGVMVRSAANVNSGAQTRLSAMFHGFLILIFILVFPHLLEKIPTPTLAAILVYTGFKLVDIKAIKDLLKFGKEELIIYLITVSCILMTNLLEGIIIGFIASIIRLMMQINILNIKTENNEHSNTMIVNVSGAANFITLPRLADALESLPKEKNINISFDNCQYVDHACINYLVNWEKNYEAKGGTIKIKLHSLTD